jgi:uncharacterized protein
MVKKIWIDITNTPQVHFLCAIARNIGANDFSFVYSTRDFSETISLLQKHKIFDYIIYGKHYGSKKIIKALGLVSRFFEMNSSSTPYDISISCGSESAIWTSWLKGKPSVAFGDNDLAKQWTYGRFVDFAFFPDAIDERILIHQGLKRHKLFLYPGFKEDIYLADYKPDSQFLDSLPFKNYVVVRPENVMANYIKNPHTKTITPELLKLLSAKGINILFLPRYKFDKEFSKGINNVFTPEKPINGLDAVYYSSGVFTGAGTLAREAACLGVPSFSFFIGRDLLAVDKRLIQQGKMCFSRQPMELLNKFLKSEKIPIDLTRSINIKDLVIKKLKSVLNELLIK